MKVFVISAAILFVAAVDVAAQMVTMNRFAFDNPVLSAEIKQLRIADPKLTAEGWAEAANVILAKRGISYGLHFDAATCDRLRKTRDTQKDPKAPLKLGAVIRSVGAEKVSLSLPEPKFKDVQCGNCFVELPIVEATDEYFVTLLLERNIKFAMPGNFSTDEAYLVEPSKKKWRLPFRAEPIGISYDENVLYLGFGGAEMEDLALAVFSEGVFQFVSRKEATESGKGTTVASSDPIQKTIRFQNWKKTFTINYAAACAN